jgi:hypothetical protein
MAIHDGSEQFHAGAAMIEITIMKKRNMYWIKLSNPPKMLEYFDCFFR